jgi:sigma-B regulation protein RsbU (phosphoserine phosphatase)
MAADKILVVENDQDFRFILERALTKNKYEVRTAVNGLEALEMLDEFQPKVVIADWMMPKMDGLQLCDTIKQQEKYKSIYFILLTARSSLRDRVKGLDVGADDFLIKPVENQELLARIRSGIRVFNLQNELRKIEHNKAIVELACTLGHQINNPLSSLTVTLKGLEKELEKIDTIEQAEDFELMYEAIERIRKFVVALQNIDNPEIVDYSNDFKMINIKE